jgi:copper chaperone CopZ
MEKLVLTISTLFGDHHTTAVKDILAKLDGVQDSYVSSAFQQVSVSFDPKLIKPETIKQSLADHGYEEEGTLDTHGTSTFEPSTHHSAAFTGTGDTLSFAQTKAPFEGRPLWPCPGLSYTATAEEA